MWIASGRLPWRRFATLLPVFGSLLLVDPGVFWWAVLAALLLGFAAGAELDLMSFLTARYFGLRHYAKIYAVLYMALAVCSGTAPFLFATIFDRTGSYNTGFLLAAGNVRPWEPRWCCALGRYPDEDSPARG